MKTYQTREEIWFDDTLTVNEKAVQIQALNERLAALPAVKPALTADQRIKGGNSRAELVALNAEITTLEADVKAAAEFVLGGREKLEMLKRATKFDAPRDNILELQIHEWRLRVAYETAAAAPAQRELLTRKLIGAFGRLNFLLEPLTSERFFVNGTRPADLIPAAVAAIDALLK